MPIASPLSESHHQQHHPTVGGTLRWAGQLLLAGLAVIGVVAGVVTWRQRSEARQRLAYAPVRSHSREAMEAAAGGPNLLQRFGEWAMGAAASSSSSARAGPSWRGLGSSSGSDDDGGGEGTEVGLSRLGADEDLLGLDAATGPDTAADDGDDGNGGGGGERAAGRKSSRLRDMLGISNWKQEKQSREEARIVREQMAQAREERGGGARDGGGRRQANGRHNSNPSYDDIEDPDL